MSSERTSKQLAWLPDHREGVERQLLRRHEAADGRDCEERGTEREDADETGAQPTLGEAEKCPAYAIAEQRDRDDHIGEVMPLNDRKEAGQHHLIGEQPRRNQRDRDERYARSIAYC